VLGAPVWWVLGLNLGIYHCAALVMFMIVMQRSYEGVRPVTIFFPAIALSGLILILFFSLAIRVPTAEPSRIAASFYNISFWLMGLMLVLSLGNQPEIAAEPRWWLSALAGLAFVTGAASLVLLFLQFRGVTDFSFASPFYFLTRIFGHTVLIENSVVIHPLYLDWVETGIQSRLNLLSPYPTAAGAVLMMLIFMSHGWASLQSKVRRSAAYFLIAANLLGLYLTLSRTAIAALIIGFIFVYLIEKKSIFIWIFMAFLLFLMTLPWLLQLINWVLEWRYNSTLGRFWLYRYSLELLQGPDWIIGMGLKPRLATVMAMPVGSHSTYLSITIKSGLLGLFLFLLFQANIFFRWYGIKDKIKILREDHVLWEVVGRILISMAFWMITEDIDAPQLVCFLYFSSLGLLEALRRKVLS